MDMRIEFELLSFSVLHMIFTSLMPFEIVSQREYDY
jgi:hypothetical protein